MDCRALHHTFRRCLPFYTTLRTEPQAAVQAVQMRPSLRDFAGSNSRNTACRTHNCGEIRQQSSCLLVLMALPQRGHSMGLRHPTTGSKEGEDRHTLCRGTPQCKSHFVFVHTGMLEPSRCLGMSLSRELTNQEPTGIPGRNDKPQYSRPEALNTRKPP